MSASPLLSVRDLSVAFTQNGRQSIAVDHVSFDIAQGETVALVGESGSGKSVSALSILKLLPYPPASHPSGQILFNGQDLLDSDENDLRRVRGNDITMIFQEPMTSLNPLHTIEKQIVEVLKLHQGMADKPARQRTLALLHEVGIREPEKRLDAYPHQLSGGQRQRVMIAMALANKPKLLIADEPTTALDVTVQAQILQLLADLKKAQGMSMLFITHDLGIVRKIADRVCVMTKGKIVETGPTRQIFDNPQHEYTRGLLRSIPKFHEKDYSKLVPIEGQPVDLLNRPKGCCFAPRCSNCMKICLEQPPVRNEYDSLGGALVGENVHYGRCWLEQKAQILGSAEAAVVSDTQSKTQTEGEQA